MSGSSTVEGTDYEVESLNGQVKLSILSTDKLTLGMNPAGSSSDFFLATEGTTSNLVFSNVSLYEYGGNIPLSFENSAGSNKLAGTLTATASNQYCLSTKGGLQFYGSGSKFSLLGTGSQYHTLYTQGMVQITDSANVHLYSQNRNALEGAWGSSIVVESGVFVAESPKYTETAVGKTSVMVTGGADTFVLIQGTEHSVNQILQMSGNAQVYSATQMSYQEDGTILLPQGSNLAKHFPNHTETVKVFVSSGSLELTVTGCKAGSEGASLNVTADGKSSNVTLGKDDAYYFGGEAPVLP